LNIGFQQNRANAFPKFTALQPSEAGMKLLIEHQKQNRAKMRLIGVRVSALGSVARTGN
jgi:hypothetical protein